MSGNSLALDSVVVLIPSPLNGPLVWAPVSRALRSRGVKTTIAPLLDSAGSALPFWIQHATAVARHLGSLPLESSVVLVAHSGAGMLVPAIGAFSPCPITKYVFVDAGLPFGSLTRMDEIEVSDADFAGELRRRLAAGGLFPEWTDEEARDVIPDDALRLAVLSELRPRSLAFFTEPLPVFAGWPDAPCCYLQLSRAYERAVEQAVLHGWTVTRSDHGHFHMLVHPVAVAGTLLDLIVAG